MKPNTSDSRNLTTSYEEYANIFEQIISGDEEIITANITLTREAVVAIEKMKQDKTLESLKIVEQEVHNAINVLEKSTDISEIMFAKDILDTIYRKLTVLKYEISKADARSKEKFSKIESKLSIAQNQVKKRNLDFFKEKGLVCYANSEPMNKTIILNKRLRRTNIFLKKHTQIEAYTQEEGGPIEVPFSSGNVQFFNYEQTKKLMLDKKLRFYGQEGEPKFEQDETNERLPYFLNITELLSILKQKQKSDLFCCPYYINSNGVLCKFEEGNMRFWLKEDKNGTLILAELKDNIIQKLPNKIESVNFKDSRPKISKYFNYCYPVFVIPGE